MKAAIWARVSTSEQETENQVAQLRAWAERRGFEVVEVYRVEESAFTGRHRPALSRVLDDARAGRFSVLLVWALDRLERGGVLATMQTWDRLTRSGVQVLSRQEPWTETAGDMRELLLAITGWVAAMESHRRSERTKAGMQRARADGKAIGRPVGSKDGRRRKRSGYVARWESPEERERARARAVSGVNKGPPR